MAELIHIDRPPSIPNESSDRFNHEVNLLSMKSTSNDGSKITLKSRELRSIVADILSEHLDHIQEVNWAVTEPVIDKPYEMVFWYWEELWEATRSSKGSERGRELLSNFLENISNLDPRGVKLTQSISVITKVRVKDLWRLFRPGTWVLSKHYLDEPQIFRVRDTYHRDNHQRDNYRRDNYQRDNKKDSGIENNQRSFVVLAWALGWRGTELVQEHYEFFVGYEHSDDEKTITDLPCYPIKYHRDDEGHHGNQIVAALNQQLVERGQLFRKLCRRSLNAKHQDYQGELLYYEFGRFDQQFVGSWEVSVHT